MGPFQPCAGQQLDASALDSGMDPVAVVLTSCSQSLPSGASSTKRASCGLTHSVRGCVAPAVIARLSQETSLSRRKDLHARTLASDRHDNATQVTAQGCLDAILAYVTRTVDQELLARNDYLAIENRILKSQLKGRLKLSDAERKALGAVGHRLGRKALACRDHCSTRHHPGLVPQARRPQVRWFKGAPIPR